MTTRKYEFTGETRGKLNRIRRLSDGALGGWIEHEGNLSHDGIAWVGDEAEVSGDARVFECALVYGRARVSGSASVHGFAKVFDRAQVSGYVWLFGHAQASGDAILSGALAVYEHAQVSGNARLYGTGQVASTARITSRLKTVVRSDGYTFAVFPCADGVWRVTAGCRLFTMDKAWEHWKATRGGTKLGEETLDILTMLERHVARGP